MEEDEEDFTTNYIVTKKEGKFYITQKGQDGPFLNGVEVDGMNKWIDHEDSLHRRDLSEVELKLIVSSTKASQNWQPTVIYLSNLI